MYMYICVYIYIYIYICIHTYIHIRRAPELRRPGPAAAALQEADRVHHLKV